LFVIWLFLLVVSVWFTSGIDEIISIEIYFLKLLNICKWQPWFKLFLQFCKLYWTFKNILCLFGNRSFSFCQTIQNDDKFITASNLCSYQQTSYMMLLGKVILFLDEFANEFLELATNNFFSNSILEIRRWFFGLWPSF
jgi:hypothetical protein